MNQAELLELVRGDLSIIPFLGAGMAIGAGIPGVGELSASLARSAGVDLGSLEDVVAAAEGRIGREETRAAVARIIGGPRPKVDPRLLKLAQWPARKILTSNYDLAIEHAACAAGYRVQSIGPKSTKVLSMERGVVKVIHVHGHIDDPPSIVLPGATTEELVEDDAFLTQVRGVMEQGTMLYLGFSFAESEVHLRGVLLWLRQIEDARRHLLVLPEGSLAGGSEDLADLRRVPQLTVASYVADRDHSFLEQLSAVHAFRPDATGKLAPLFSDAEEEVPYLEPALISEEEGEGVEALQQKLWGIEGGWGDPATFPRELAVHGRAVLVGSPGMGKTEALRQLARTSEPQCALIVSAAELRARLSPEAGVEQRLSALAAAIARGIAGREGTPLPDLTALDHSSYLFLVDDFDQGRAEERELVAAALTEACERWPQHRWVIASRPSAELARLEAGGFERFRIFPSAKWGRAYLEQRGVPATAIEWLLGEQTGFREVMGIPLFAAEAATRLLGGGDLPQTPLELLVETQRDSAAGEARRGGRGKDDLFLWLRRLAVGLELRGRTEAAVEEVAEVPGRGTLNPEEAREELVRASLLAEIPDLAAFPRRTLQEALCASAILASEDPLARLKDVSLGEVAGESHLRSDTEFMIDLVFEAAPPELRPQLRELDQSRWARTVAARGTLEDGRDALNILLAEAERRGRLLSNYAVGLRAPMQAVRAITRRWPELVDERRETLVGETRSDRKHSRFNALWILAGGQTDPDLSWLAALIEDDVSWIALVGAETAVSWQAREMIPALETALGKGNVHHRKRLLRVLLELTDRVEEKLRVIASLLGDGQLIGEAAGEIAQWLNLDGCLELLSIRTHDSRIWEWLLDRALDCEENWSEERVERLVGAVIDHDGDPATAQDPRLMRLIEGHLETALTAARRAHFQQPVAYRGLAMFAALPEADLAGGENEAIREEAKRAVAPEELKDWRRAPQLDWQEMAEAKLEDPEASAESVLDPEIKWRIVRMSEGQRRRLRKLAEENLPSLERDLDIEKFSQDESDRLALGALSAAAQLELPLERERWLQLLRSPRALESATYLFGWIEHHYSPDYDEAIEAYLKGLETPEALPTLIAALPRDADAPRRAVVAALDQYRGDLRGWASAAGLLAESEGPEPLLRLREGERSERQEDALRVRLARLGEPHAQRETIEQVIEEALAGMPREDPPWWDRPISNTGVLERCADLLLALGVERSDSKWWDFALGKLVGSATPDALAALERVSAELVPAALEGARETLVRRLATDQVLARLPEPIAEAAMLLEPAVEGAAAD